MDRLSRLWHAAKHIVFAVAMWLTLCGMALAQARSQAQEPETSGPPYVGPYFVVILCLAMGLMAVCNPSRRKEKAKPEQFEAPPEEKDTSVEKLKT